MKLQIRDYDYTHKKYLTYAENTSDPLVINGAIGIYPITMVKTGTVYGTLEDITTYWGGAVVDSPNYIQLEQGASVQLTFKNANEILGEIGEFSTGVTGAFMGVIAQGQGASSKFDITFNHIADSPPTEYIVAPNVEQTPGTTTTYLTPDVSIGDGFEFKLYSESKLVIENTSAAAEWIRIYEVVFQIQDTVKAGVQTKAAYLPTGKAVIKPTLYIDYKRKYVNFYVPVSKDITGWDGDNVFASGHGHLYNRWIDSVSGSARSNGKNAGESIQSPTYIIESLLRDEDFVERDLRITAVTDTTHIICSGLKSSEDDFYNYSIYYNATTDHKTYISDCVGSTKTLVLASADTSAASDDNIFLTNIRGDLKIDYSSFDVLGNTTNGTRKDWLFARAFNEKQNIRDIIDLLCWEMHCELIESIDPIECINKFKIVTLDIASSGDTWTNPAYSNGIEQITAQLTPLESVYTQFRLRYFFNNGDGDFLKELYVDKNGYPSRATILGDTEKNLCKYAEQSYQISRLFEFSSMNVYDDATAERLLQKKIEWLTKQRLIVNYITPIVGNSDYIKYEIGDQVKLNFSQGIPSGLNNSAMFIITEKIITPLIGGGSIKWTLLQL